MPKLMPRDRHLLDEQGLGEKLEWHTEMTSRSSGFCVSGKMCGYGDDQKDSTEEVIRWDLER